MPVEQGQEATRSPTDYGPTFKAQTGQGSKAVSRQGSAMSRPFPAPNQALHLTAYSLRSLLAPASGSR